MMHCVFDRLRGLLVVYKYMAPFLHYLSVCCCDLSCTACIADEGFGILFFEIIGFGTFALVLLLACDKCLQTSCSAAAVLPALH